jgi:orotate phosphoribosyltransferase
MNDSISELMLTEINEITSVQLWQLGAIKINISEPFKLVSGMYSPIYINCRKVISDSLFMQLFTSFAQTICRLREIRFEVVAGSESAGIPFAAYLSHSLALPMIYVRKAVKDHGISKLVEGSFPSNAVVILIDDVITDAGTKLNACSAIRDAGGLVSDVLVIFDREQGGRQALKDNNLQLTSLTDMSTALRVGRSVGAISNQDLDSITRYLADADSWQLQRVSL